MPTSFNTQTGPNGFRLQFETKNKEYFLMVQSVARHCVDGKPVSDILQVVRCRDCEHWADWGACGHPKNGFDAPPMGPNDFCSHGKRMKKD